MHFCNKHKRRRPKKGNAGKKMGKVGENSTLLSRSHSIIYDAFVASGGITAQQLEGIGHCGFGVRPMAVIGVDDEQQTASFERGHGACAVGSGGGGCADIVAIDGKSRDVEYAATNSFVGFAFATDAEGEITVDVRHIEQTGGISASQRDEIAKIDEGAHAVEIFALQQTARKLFGGGTIARRIFAAGFVSCARGGNTRLGSISNPTTDTCGFMRRNHHAHSHVVVSLSP